ncbi:I78 family peptidase inhibitor [Comamonas sp. NLF-1-9]|uniref:I78 family peptidase inhibitor n=1 Tax=Comamonas sp. NLF-1-9 TaxID=2853163 RepID=UPI001C447266|nr:I78 family peptidase inhibitor [Comamonas sp. NLF-1-9]QXL85567.1 proteinase inhibitor I78 [Comamonas sp. NLF-1-9]
MRIRLWLAAACALGMAACTTSMPGQQQAQPAPLGRSDAPAGGTCAAAGAQAVVGKAASAQVVEQARVAAGARMARVLHPGQVTTKEFDAQRLNLEVNAKGVILAARCG